MDSVLMNHKLVIVFVLLMTYSFWSVTVVRKHDYLSFAFWFYRFLHGNCSYDAHCSSFLA